MVRGQVWICLILSTLLPITQLTMVDFWFLYVSSLLVHEHVHGS